MGQRSEAEFVYCTWNNSNAANDLRLLKGLKEIFWDYSKVDKNIKTENVYQAFTIIFPGKKNVRGNPFPINCMIVFCRTRNAQD